MANMNSNHPKMEQFFDIAHCWSRTLATKANPNAMSRWKVETMVGEQAAETNKQQNQDQPEDTMQKPNSVHVQ